MKRVSLSAFIVLTLISIDVSISMAYAKSKTTIFKVTNVSPQGSLKLRAWPSTKSRVKTSLPYNAKDLTETGKERIIGKTKWLQVNWKNEQGWVNAHYLGKTGVLLRPPEHFASKNKASRNNRSIQTTTHSENSQTVQKIVKSLSTPIESLDNPSQELGGNRYDHPVQISATEVKTSYQGDAGSLKGQKQLLCSGIKPKQWTMKMDVAQRNIKINVSNQRGFNVPINYHAWATPYKLRMNMGGNKGRNIVDVNLEKTNACMNGMVNTRFAYEVNATINKDFYSGCCKVVN